MSLSTKWNVSSSRARDNGPDFGILNFLKNQKNMNHPSNVKLHQRKVVNIRSSSRELRKIANRVRELSHKVGTKDHTMELNKEGRSLQIEADSLILKLKDWDSFLKSAINQGMYIFFLSY